MSDEYAEFLARKAARVECDGIDVRKLSPHLFDYQRDLVKWALRRGRAAIFADTGMGKTAMQVEWARIVSDKAGRVLILAPLAVAEQTVREASRFGVGIVYARSSADAPDAPIVIANYEMLHAFNASDFAGIVLDESSILKSFTGATRNAIIEAFGETPYRLACTATPSPNDHTELGNHSEFLGIKSRVEMLSEYFVHDGGDTSEWRLKGHAREAFWRWVCSWAASMRMPSDLGYPDDGFELPALNMSEHVIAVDHKAAHAEGFLFAPDVKSLSDQRSTRRFTMADRVERIVALVAAEPGEPWIIWGELNDECDAIEKAIPGAVQIAGSDSPESKRDAMLAFADGGIRVLVSKPSICGFGMNWQHCARMVFVGASHSYEQTYQAIRRCWRFGQKRQVDVHILRAETEGAIMANYRRKEAEAEAMRAGMIGGMKHISRDAVRGARRESNKYENAAAIRIPAWLKGEAP